MFQDSDVDATITTPRRSALWDQPSNEVGDYATQPRELKLWKLVRNYLMFIVLVTWIVVFWPLLVYGIWTLFE